jgi:uncharacterized protein YkwD
MEAGRRLWLLVALLSIMLLSACGAKSTGQIGSVGPSLLANNVQVAHQPTATPSTMSPGRRSDAGMQRGQASQDSALPTDISVTGSGDDPYGPPPPMTAEETRLTQQLFAQINSDRAAAGLYPYTWNATLAGGARLHSWNMYHCGFSHTCPDGIPQCDRIAAEGFAGYTDCGENIGYAGPFPTPWQGVYNIQESMANEPPTGWHHIHLFSTTLHRIGVGVYVDPSGYIWFTEDMVS